MAAYYKQRSPVVKAANSLKEAIAPRPDWEPDTMECFIGGFLGDSYKVRWEKNKLTYTAYDSGYAEREVVELTAGRRSSGTRSGTSWTSSRSGAGRPSYGEHRGDHSTIFSVSIEHQGTDRSSRPVPTAFPPAGRPLEESEAFSRFCSAISRLTAGWRSAKRTAERAARLVFSRAVPSSSALRSRTDCGVASTHSSSRRNSSAWSSASLRGGTSRTSSSAVAERMLVRCFSLRR